MSWLAASGLAALHFFHLAWTVLTALLYYPFLANPLPLRTYRTKVPKNLALVLATTGKKPSEEEKDAIVKSVVSVVQWCKIAGINGLSVYDRHGLAVKLSNRIRAEFQFNSNNLLSESESSSDASDTDCTPTPPLPAMESKSIMLENWCSPPSIITFNLDSESLHVYKPPFRHSQVSNGFTRKQARKPSRMTLSLVSYEASKALLATVAQTFATSANQGLGTASEGLGISVEDVDKRVQELLHLAPPDFMIVHSVKQYSLSCPPLELHGFQPWLMKLTEFYYDTRPSLYRAWQNRGNKKNYVPLSEENFRRALDSYARAEMRFGK